MDAAADQKGKLEGEGRHKRQDSQAGPKAEGRRQKATVTGKGQDRRQGFPTRRR